VGAAVSGCSAGVEGVGVREGGGGDDGVPDHGLGGGRGG